MKQSLLRRGLSLLLCLSIILGISVARPQKAEAFAISASLVASVIMIMTACGVTFWASTQGDAESYIADKLGEYFDTLQSAPSSALEWLGIDSTSELFTVLSGGFVSFRPSVSNPILDFIRWFNSSEGVESGGPVITNGGFEVVGRNSYAIQSGSFEISTRDNIVTMVMDAASSNNNSGGITFVFKPAVDRQATVRATIISSDIVSQTWSLMNTNDEHYNGVGGVGQYTTSDSYSQTAYTSDYMGLAIGIRRNQTVSGTVVFELTSDDGDVATPTTAAVTPSQSVAVPDDLADDESFDASPSVSLSEGMSVDEASSAIFDGVTSADGLSSTGEAVDPPALDLSGILEYLGSILNAILAIPGHIAALPSAIASAFNSILSSIKSVLDSIADKVTSAAQSIIDGINAKLDNFIYQMQFALSGVVSSIQRIGQNVRDALMMWLDDFITDVQSAIDTIKQTVIGIPQAISQAGQDVITGIVSGVQQVLIDVFVPDEAFVGEFVASLYGTFDNRFSILSYPFSILGEFITRASGIGNPEPVLSWPNIIEPFSNRTIISSGSYNLNTIKSNSSFNNVYSLYMIIIKGYISFEFLTFLYLWFCDVFHMRENDYVSPLDDYGGVDE